MSIRDTILLIELIRRQVQSVTDDVSEKPTSNMVENIAKGDALVALGNSKQWLENAIEHLGYLVGDDI